MNERLLQYIWQFQYFNRTGLTTTEADVLQIISPGQFNTNQGPDFTNAKICIDKTTWAGSVELHILTSDWVRHHHQQDENYRNVILHVVWEDDCASANGKKRIPIPVLELKDRVSKLLLSRYECLMRSASFIACENNIHTVPDIVWKAWKDSLLAGRLLRKSAMIGDYLNENNFHWEETFWWLLTRNFGIPVNAEAFEAVARSIPLTILSKHKKSIHQLEGLLLGQAGLLKNKFMEDYPALLQREYRFLARKYSLQPILQPVHFLRMRPGNFPGLRLAQLAKLVTQSEHLFSTIKDAGTVKQIRTLFNVTANDYWHYHYRFDETSVFKEKKLGEAMIDNLIINTVSPVLFAYGNHYNEPVFKQRAVDWLGATLAENNSIINKFLDLGIASSSAFDSQALIELKKEYCEKKRCLECAVGNYILKA